MAKNELARRAFETVAALESATSIDELDAAVAPVFRDLGFPFFAAASFFAADRRASTRLLCGRFHEGWAQRYVAGNYSRGSSIAAEMLLTNAPYSWQEVLKRRGLGPTQARIWNEARDFGLTEGLFTPVRWSDGSYAAVVLSGSAPPVSDPLARTMAEVLSSYYAQHGRRLLAGSEDEAPLALSPRQRECLAWVRLGKSSSDIADILGLSPPTVDGHIAEACRRLGVRTRVQAAVEAAMRGLIDP